LQQFYRWDLGKTEAAMNFETGISADQTANDNPLLLVTIAYFVTRSGSGAAAEEKKDQAPTVTVVTPGRITVEGTINATGTLAARRELPVGIAGEGGQVVSVLVEPGQWVRAGQVLAVIDRSVQVQQASSQNAQIQVARANADLAEANYQRAL
jgi:HlyD family secretion protein